MIEKEILPDNVGNRRKRQAENTRSRLMESIIHLMDTVGYHRMTIDEICTHACVSKGTFYHYFSSKHDILQLMCRQANDNILQMLEFDENSCAKELFERYIDVIVEETLRVGPAAEARMLVALLTSGADESYRETDAQTNYVERILKHGVARGELPASCDISSLNRLVTMAIQGCVTRWTISEGRMDLHELMHGIFSVLWHG